MTQLAVEGFRDERANVVDVLRSLTPAEWEAASACAGWTVKDVATHMASSMQLVADPANAVFPEPGQAMEASQDVVVEARRDMTAEQVLGLYEDVSANAIDAFASLQLEGVAENELDMGDLGTHAMHYLPNAFVFDAYTHLRIDLLGPDGPIRREIAAPTEAVLGATTEWLIAGLPQMCTEALKPALSQSVELVLTGTGGGSWTLSPSETDRACDVVEGATGEAVVRVTSSVGDFVSWSTKRSDWRDTAEVSGDVAYAATVLDSINLI